MERFTESRIVCQHLREFATTTTTTKTNYKSRYWDLVPLPTTRVWGFTEEKDCHKVLRVGVLQVSCCQVFRVLWYGSRRVLHRLGIENELDKMQCYCERPLRMSQSQSEKKPGRLFFIYPKRNCKFFQWVDQTPSKKVNAWLLESQHPSNHAGYPRPHELFKPDRQNYVSNWLGQLPYKKQSNRFCDEQIVWDHVISEPGTPFDQELWGECQKVNIFCRPSRHHWISAGIERASFRSEKRIPLGIFPCSTEKLTRARSWSPNKETNESHKTSPDKFQLLRIPGHCDDMLHWFYKNCNYP